MQAASRVCIQTATPFIHPIRNCQCVWRNKEMKNGSTKVAAIFRPGKGSKECGKAKLEVAGSTSSGFLKDTHLSVNSLNLSHALYVHIFSHLTCDMCIWVKGTSSSNSR